MTQEVETRTIWPEGQQLGRVAGETIAVTRFADWEEYHAELIALVLQLENDPAFCSGRFPGGCGNKVRDIPRWDHAAATLVHERALELFRRVTGSETAVADETWASIYENGDYCMPHSHLRANGSVVYLLDAGDGPDDDPLGGKLCFADPRLPACCQVVPGHMTNLLIPDMQPGSMIIFPATAVHAVAPYKGTRKRITLSWNIATAVIPGTPRRMEG